MAVIAGTTATVTMSPAAMPLKFLVLLNWSGAVVVASSFAIKKSFFVASYTSATATCAATATIGGSRRLIGRITLAMSRSRLLYGCRGRVRFPIGV
jgi:hypothetical protein